MEARRWEVPEFLIRDVYNNEVSESEGREREKTHFLTFSRQIAHLEMLV